MAERSYVRGCDRTKRFRKDTDVQQSKGRKLPWIIQRSSLSSSCWSYCSAGAAVTIGVDDGRLVDLSLARTFELQEYVLFILFSS